MTAIRILALVFTVIAFAGMGHAQDLGSVALATQVFTGGLPVDDRIVRTEWTVDISTSTRNNFKVFGSTASEDPVVIGIVKADFGKWDVSLIVCEGVGEHEEGVGATETYYNVVLGRGHDFGEDGQGSFWVGTELFYAPPQLGGEHLQFFAPLAALSWDWSENISSTVGAQAPFAIDTVYGGDAVFGWAEVTFSYTRGNLTVSLTPGGVLGDTGRYTLYLAPSAEWEFENGLTFYASGLEAKTVVQGVASKIDPTPSIGFTYDF
jgi:hypothetical protein